MIKDSGDEYGGIDFDSATLQVQSIRTYEEEVAYCQKLLLRL